MKRLLAMFLVAICLMLVGCGSDSESTTTTSSSAPTTTVAVTTQPTATTQPVTGTTEAAQAPADAEVKIMGIGGLEPEVVTVKVGGTVRWIVTDDRRHSLMGDNGVFRSGSLSEGDQFEYTFNEAGEFNYLDIPFGRRATVIVE